MDWITSIASENTQKKLKAEWKAYLKTGQCGCSVRNEVKESWDRCRKQEIDPYNTIPKKLEDDQEIRSRLARNERLLKVSKPAIRNLYDFNAGTSNLLVSVSDSDGYLLLVHSEEEKQHPRNDILYTNWSEDAMGTNPIGTAIYEKKTIAVIGYEHYTIYPHHYAGIGAPILDSKGKIIGAVSITGVEALAEHDTFGMTMMTAYAISRELKLEETLSETDKAYQHRNAIIDSISENVIIFDSEYKISFVNNVFRHMCNGSANPVGNSVFQYFKDLLVQAMLEKNAITSDYVTEITIGEEVIPCTITLRNLEGYNEGIIICNEISRVKKLAKKIYDNSVTLNIDAIVGENKRFKESIDIAKSFAATDTNVLLLGESGTGKEVFAQGIHNYSGRKKGPFVPVNCGAIPKELIASDLFGHVEGAFTGAKKGGSIGKFEQANNGTIFLDEIGEMPIELQSTLLRVLETKVINKVGDQNYIPVNVRVIAATNKNLSLEIERNNFRRDLYYRLNILSLQMIPLRDRKDDIPLLVEYFIKKMNFKHGKSVHTVDQDIWGKLIAYSWPGNIRELQNIIERCVALSDSERLDSRLLPEGLSKSEKTDCSYSGNITDGSIKWDGSINTNPAAVRGRIIAALEKNHWNISKTAKSMGVSRSTLYRRLKDLGIK